MQLSNSTCHGFVTAVQRTNWHWWKSTDMCLAMNQFGWLFVEHAAQQTSLIENDKKQFVTKLAAWKMHQTSIQVLWHRRMPVQTNAHDTTHLHMTFNFHELKCGSCLLGMWVFEFAVAHVDFSPRFASLNKWQIFVFSSCACFVSNCKFFQAFQFEVCKLVPMQNSQFEFANLDKCNRISTWATENVPTAFCFYNQNFSCKFLFLFKSSKNIEISTKSKESLLHFWIKVSVNLSAKLPCWTFHKCMCCITFLSLWRSKSVFCLVLHVHLLSWLCWSQETPSRNNFQWKNSSLFLSTCALASCLATG